MQDIKISFNEIAVYVTIINIVLGLLFGSFPLILGLKAKKRRFAVYGFIGSLIGGAILGVFLAYPIAIIFTWLILKNPALTAEAAAVHENSIDVPAEEENLIDVQPENLENR